MSNARPDWLLLMEYQIPGSTSAGWKVMSPELDELDELELPLEELEPLLEPLLELLEELELLLAEEDEELLEPEEAPVMGSPPQPANPKTPISTPGAIKLRLMYEPRDHSHQLVLILTASTRAKTDEVGIMRTARREMQGLPIVAQVTVCNLIALQDDIKQNILMFA